MEKFEYRTLVFDTTGIMGGRVDGNKIELVLNQLGAQGWELITTTASNQSYGSTRSMLCIFKRKI